MADQFREIFEGLKQTAEGLIQANIEIKRAAEAALEVKGEHEDLRETVQRLEALVVKQGEELRALRQRLNGDGEASGSAPDQ